MRHIYTTYIYFFCETYSLVDDKNWCGIVCKHSPLYCIVFLIFSLLYHHQPENVKIVRAYFALSKQHLLSMMYCTLYTTSRDHTTLLCSYTVCTSAACETTACWLLSTLQQKNTESSFLMISFNHASHGEFTKGSQKITSDDAHECAECACTDDLFWIAWANLANFVCL